MQDDIRSSLVDGKALQKYVQTELIRYITLLNCTAPLTTIVPLHMLP